MQEPALICWNAMEKDSRYLKGTTKQGLVYRNGGGVSVFEYSDYDCSQDKRDRRLVAEEVSRSQKVH